MYQKGSGDFTWSEKLEFILLIIARMSVHPYNDQQSTKNIYLNEYNFNYMTWSDFGTVSTTIPIQCWVYG